MAVDDSLTFETLDPSAADPPPEVAAAVREADRCVLVSVSRAERVVAYLVAAPEERWVEVFELGDPASGWVGPAVSAARRFRLLANQVVNDRKRYFSAEDDDPSGDTLIVETFAYREPDQMVHRIEPSGRPALENVFDGVDISEQYAPTPGPGDWAFFLEFGRD